MNNASQQIPQALQAQLEKYHEQIQSNPYFQYPACVKSIDKVLVCSEFIARYCIQKPDIIYQLFSTDDITRCYEKGHYQNVLSNQLDAIDNEAELKKHLRIMRQREMLRIAWRDLSGWADLTETTLDLSNFADACINYVNKKCQQWMSIEEEIIVIAMGKLGGQELNFSSDVDLIFCHNKLINDSNETKITRLAQQLIRILSDINEEGFVFRVDMRLRPYGDSGPLVISIAALENYYQQQGRDWERYALTKARIINNNPSARQQIMKIIQAFVYRRYVDFGVIDALREIKQLINREIKLQNLQNNVKRGPGGIREIEFIAQAIQLIRGGKEPHLRVTNLLKSLNIIANSRILPKKTLEELTVAYIFLRQLEHRLQMVNDQQTHQFPYDEISQQRIAFSMGYSTTEDFTKKFKTQRKKVENHFKQMFEEQRQQLNHGPTKAMTTLTGIWLEQLNRDSAEKQLAIHGFDKAADSLNDLQKLRKNPKHQQLSQKAKSRLDKFMPLLLNQSIQTTSPSLTLQRCLSIVHAILKRSSYFSLLLENPQALEQLVKLCAASSWIADQLARHPILLDELILPGELFKPLTLDELQYELQHQCLSFPEDDLELQLDCLRRFKHSHVLHVAAADITNTIDLATVSNHLTHIAEVILNRIQQLALNQLLQKMTDAHSKRSAYTFGIVAYGKLGGIELGYGSDLDLVFLSDKSIDDSHFYTRLAQRIINMLNMQTTTGALYQIDTRLRPSGNAGLLVSSIDAFEKYQLEHAWAWEHQALVRARMISGHANLVEKFQQIRQHILCQIRDKKKLQQDIVEMRNKMRANSRNPEQDLRQAPGGVIDIEFISQYLVLFHSHKHPNLCRYTDNIGILNCVAQEKILDSSDSKLLISAYKAYRKVNHQAALQNQQALLDQNELQTIAKKVSTLWENLFC